MSWIAGIIELFGTWIVGNKSKWGFLFNIAASIAWITFALTNIKVNGGLLIICVPAVFINIRNFFKWTREDAL